ncbi:MULTISPECIES: sensor domain-containing protein [unclassified Rhodanobacter]|uniref:sensor domain-containing protein n=1 Tax=unclassified Rhodanobacter TaxID=2621553 RepID=UPI001BDF3D45|nr:MULTISPECIES: sensor domain-containing protein [unclassified Rhodanobacter]MBT2142886.1 sensor domain-containing protein [Rhodanobacter sp. LX-99]MBT2148041.1 sensor domain-containing protein [Rhodanobacter sp. LX-100]
MNAPRTIVEYLEQLRAALRGADPALIQDALYDAEEHLRAELAEQPGRGEAEMLEHVVGSYGAPDEVAEIYRDQEIKIQRALRPPPPPKRRSLAGRFFGVAADPRTYGALFYMLLSLATGIFYFTWAVTGLSLSVGLSVLIIGLPFIVLFFGSVRVLSLVEGRIVEAMLGMRMPRRPVYPTQGMGLMKRIGSMFTDVHTWTTLCYMWLMLPLGIVYFTLAVTLLSVSVAFIGAPLAMLFQSDWLPGLYANHRVVVDWGFGAHAPGWGDAIAMCVIGIVLLFATLHLARGLGRLHGHVAKHMLVPRAAD